MGKRRDPEAEFAEVSARAKEIVTVVAARDFTDSEGNFHKAGEDAEVTRDELDRALIPHGLVTTKAAWASRKQAEEDEAAARELLEDRSAAARGFGDEAEGSGAAVATATEAAAATGRRSKVASKKSNKK